MLAFIQPITLPRFAGAKAARREPQTRRTRHPRDPLV